MTALGLNLLWSALQVTVLGLVAIVLGARPWRVGGAFTPLIALMAIALITVCNFVPLPTWWPAAQDTGSIRSNVSTASELEVASSNRSNHEVDADQPGGPSQKLNIKPTTVGQLATIFVDELKSVGTQADERWMASSIPVGVVSVFACAFAIGFIRLILGVRGAHEIGRRSHAIQDRGAIELLDVLQAELGVRTKIQLRQADELASAATVGYFAPVILLPMHWRSWQPDELRAVLCHELAHIHHRDFAAQLLAQVGLILHFYNPVVHWLSERMKLEQELAADAVAARLAGGQRQYLRVLATLALDQQSNHVGWPARAFLPTRHSFLRRLEMLKVSNTQPAGPRIGGRLCAMLVIALITVGLITLRPDSSMTARASTETSAVQSVSPAAEYELRYLGEDVELICGARPLELMKNPQLKGLLGASGDSLLRTIKLNGVKLEDVEQVVIGHDNQRVAATLSVYVRLAKPQRIRPQDVQGTLLTINGNVAIETQDHGVIWQPDEQTIIINKRARIEKFMDGRFPLKAFASSQAWMKVKQDDAFVLISGKLARHEVELSRVGTPEASIPPLQGLAPYISPIVDEAAYIGIGASSRKEFQITLATECLDEKGVKVVTESASSSITLLKKSLRDFSQATESQVKDSVDSLKLLLQLAQFGLSSLDRLESKAEGQMATWVVRVPANEFPVELIGAVVGSARKAAQRTASMSNLKQIGLACHIYHDVYKTFPTSSANRFSEQQKPYKFPFSWRVAILPYIEQTNLYEKYKFDEPWDSPANLEVLKQMPAIYRHPEAPADSTDTSYVALSGKGTMFPSDGSMKIQDVTDGLSNTIMIVEAKSLIPWTRPEDLPYSADKPLPKLGGYSDEGYNVVLGDGSVQFLAKSLDEGLLRKLVTAQGGEAIQ